MIYQNEREKICKKRCVVYQGEKVNILKKQWDKGIPFGPIASTAAPFFGKVAKPLLKKFLVVRVRKDEDERKKQQLVVMLFPNELDCPMMMNYFCGMID